MTYFVASAPIQSDMLSQASLEGELITARRALKRLFALMLLHMNVEQSVCLEDLIAFEARLDLAVEVYEAVNPELFLHLEVNIALFALEIELIAVVLVRDVMMIVPRGLVGK